MNDYWNIARALVGVAKNPDELGRFTHALKNKASRDRIIGLLERMAADEHSTGRPRPRENKTSQPTSLAQSDVELVQALFRDGLHLTSADVQQWLGANFGVTQSVNKEALGKYLERVFRKRPQSFVTQLVRELHREVARAGPSRPEVKEFADRLDARGRPR